MNRLQAYFREHPEEEPRFDRPGLSTGERLAFVLLAVAALGFVALLGNVIGYDQGLAQGLEIARHR